MTSAYVYYLVLFYGSAVVVGLVGALVFDWWARK
jgi:hypothetical protein